GAHLGADIFRCLAQDCLHRAIRHGRRSALPALSVPAVFPYGSLLRGSKCPKSASPWKNGTARALVPEGGSDPTELLGGCAAEKWGGSCLFQSFFHGDFCLRFVPELPLFHETARAPEGVSRR